MSSSRADSRVKQGYFETLIHVIAAGFDPSSDTAKLVDRDWKDGGILIFSNTELDYMKSALTKKNMPELETFQWFLSYQFEMAYGVGITPSLDVSRSFGFEAFLGMFGGEE